MNSRDLMEAARPHPDGIRPRRPRRRGGAAPSAPRTRPRCEARAGCSRHVGVHSDRGPVVASTSCRGRERGTEQDDRREPRAGAHEITQKPLTPIMPGFVHNPSTWMACTAVFVLSSAWEGLPTVVIESLAEAILATLDEPPRRDLLRRRARHFFHGRHDRPVSRTSCRGSGRDHHLAPARIHLLQASQGRRDQYRDCAVALLRTRGRRHPPGPGSTASLRRRHGRG